VAGQEVHRLSYEELAHADPARRDEAMRAALRFLGVDAGGAPPPALRVTVKQSTRPLAEGVVNHSELATAFRHHPRLRGAFLGGA
jgi:hypothetical protein